MKDRNGLALPAWLNGQTVAIVGTVLTVGVGIGGMVFASTSSIRGEIKAARAESRTDIQGLDARLRVVEQAVAAIQGRLAVSHPEAQGASPTGREENDGDA